jgi:hypothetical protein
MTNTANIQGTDGGSFTVVLPDHRENEVAVAKALSFAMMGDEVDWRQHLTNAKRFILHMRRTVPGCALPNGERQ